MRIATLLTSLIAGVLLLASSALAQQIDLSKDQRLDVKICGKYETNCYVRIVTISGGKIVDIDRQSGEDWGEIQSSFVQMGELHATIAQVRKNVPRVISMVINLKSGKVHVFGPLSGGRKGNFVEYGEVVGRS